jgi:cytoskeletal protein RodZ
MSVEQVASATKIGVKRILSLEADEYSDLPAKPFIRGFVISYCRFLGLDSNDTLTRFSVFLDGKVNEHQIERKYVEGYAFERKSGDRGRTLLMSAMAGFILIGALVILILKPNLRHKKVTHLERLKQAHQTQDTKKEIPNPDDFVGPKLESDLKPADPATSTLTPPVAPPVPPPAPAVVSAQAPAPETSPTPSATPAATFTPQSSDPLNKGDMLPTAEVKEKLSVRSKEDVWIRYKIDDKPAMKLFFKRGKLLLFRGKDKVRFQASRPDAIEYRYNDKGSYKAMSASENLISTANSPTFVFPPQNLENSKDLFQGMAPLPEPVNSGGSGASSSSQ